MSLEVRSLDGEDAPPVRRPWRAMGLGLRLRCPNCREGKLFRAFLKPVDACQSCGEELHHQRADDAPPYVVITIVAHVVIALLLAVEIAYRPAVWVHLALWIPLTIGLSLALLPPVKGALIALQWALRMHGFGDENDGAHIADGGLRPTPRA